MTSRLLKFALTLLLFLGVVTFWIVQPGVSPLAPLSVSPNIDIESLRRDVTYLAERLGRRNFAHPATLGRAAAYIKDSFSRSGGLVSEQDYEVEGVRYVNVIARFGPATGAPVILGAHYDAEEETRGADDNASGVAALLEVARHLGGQQNLKVPVELVAYTLEEPPYFMTEQMGSWRHAQALQASGVQPRLVVVLEMLGFFSDQPASQTYPVPFMVGLYPDRANFIALVGNLGNPGVIREVKSAMLAGSDLPVRSINAPAWVPGVDFSDHASYWAHGIPAVMVTDTSFYRNPNYHKASDLPATLDFVRMGKVVSGLLRLIQHAQLSG